MSFFCNSVVVVCHKLALPPAGDLQLFLLVGKYLLKNEAKFQGKLQQLPIDIHQRLAEQAEKSNGDLIRLFKQSMYPHYNSCNMHIV